MRLAVEGPMVIAKDDDVVTEKAAEETAVWLPEAMVMLPLTAPAGTTKETALAEKEDTGAGIVPPAAAVSVTCGVEP